MIDTLTKQLFLGTRKGGDPMADAPGCLAQVFQDLDTHSGNPEEKLLGRCCLATLFNAAAYKPGWFPDETPEPSEKDVRPPVGERARQILREALGQAWTPLIHEWIGLTREYGGRPPFEHLPALLDLARNSRALRQDILNFGGPRARWLARINPAWMGLFLPDSDDEEKQLNIWEEGTLSQRCDVIRSLRQRDKEKARDWIKGVLSSENAATRNTLIGLLTTGLEEGDESMLEHLLEKDRSLEVRRTAANLLSRISGSALGLRMKERLSACILLSKGLIKRSVLVEPPQEADEAMKQDSIMDKAMGGMGKQAVMLKRMVALTPLNWWHETFSMVPGQILTMIRKTDWEKALFLGLAEAAVTQQDGPWILALLECPDSKKVSLDRNALVQSLSPSDREAWLLGQLSPSQPHLVRMLLDDRDSSPGFFSPETSMRILNTVQSSIQRRKGDYTLRDFLKRLGFYMHPRVLEQALKGWPEHHSHWPYYSEQAFDLFHIIKCRIDLNKELS